MKVGHHEPIYDLMLAIDIFIMYIELKAKIEEHWDLGQKGNIFVTQYTIQKVPLNQFIKDSFLSQC